MSSPARLCSFTLNPKPGPSPSESGKSPRKCSDLGEASVFPSRDGRADRNPLPPATLRVVRTKAAAKDDGKAKPRSMVCGDCDGNGAVLCSQCKGSGVNTEDLFDGQFKAGDSCWLCGGRKEMLCGNCNGAGFIGGFMSTLDE